MCLSFLYSLLIMCFLLSSCVSRRPLFNLKHVFAVKDRKMEESSSPQQRTHTIQLDSLLPKSTCMSSPQGHTSKDATLTVIHKRGSCSHLKQDRETVLTPKQIFAKDKNRVYNINNRLAISSMKNNLISSTKEGMIPETKYQSNIGLANYITIVSLGSPKQELSFIIDTSIDLTWVRCKKRLWERPLMNESFFPLKSKSYTTVDGTSFLCLHLNSTPGVWLTNCGASSICKYVLYYTSHGSTVGHLSKERLTLTPHNMVNNFVYGCSYDKRDSWGNAAGILGLGTQNISIINQSKETYRRMFSYCLPSVSSYTGYLRFGDEPRESMIYTPLKIHDSTFYGVDITGISVGGQLLPIGRTVFLNTYTIIDSGTEITQLPPIIYKALREEFMKKMDYPITQSHFTLDTCYNLSSYNLVAIPTLTFHFVSGIKVDIHPTGILYVVNKLQACLAFTKNLGGIDAAILGNMMQKTLEMVYDINHNRIGFRPGGCL